MIDDYLSVLEKELVNKPDDTHLDLRLDIFSLTACSNVTGKKYDIMFNSLWTYIKKKRLKNHKIYLLFDYACSAPYDAINLDQSDGIFFSGHKFLGGQSTPGVLIINKSLYNSNNGKTNGTCDYYNYKQDPDPNMKDMDEGTPNIVGIIRLGYCMMVKQSIIDIIINNEHILSKYITNMMAILQKKYPKFKAIELENRSINDLPIYPIMIKGLHYNLVTILLNDLFGIQTKGGIGVSCCSKENKCQDLLSIDGWCRVTFSYLHSKQEVLNIMKAIEFVIINGESFKKYYNYDSIKEKN
jgi:selenocysteine lyase/cysteine desulfurase